MTTNYAPRNAANPFAIVSSGILRNPDLSSVECRVISILLNLPHWFNRLASKAPNKLKAFRDGGFTGRLQPIIAPRPSGTRGASRAQTISLNDLTKLIAVEANAGNKRAIAIQSAFTLEGLDSRFRDAFGVSQLSPDAKRQFFGMTFEQYLEALADNQAELDALQLPGDSLYYLEGEEDVVW